MHFVKRGLWGIGFALVNGTLMVQGIHRRSGSFEKLGGLGAPLNAHSITKNNCHWKLLQFSSQNPHGPHLKKTTSAYWLVGW
jgi:hypothetical protein